MRTLPILLTLLFGCSREPMDQVEDGDASEPVQPAERADASLRDAKVVSAPEPMDEPMDEPREDPVDEPVDASVAVVEDAGQQSVDAASGRLLPVDSVADAGPYEVVILMNSGPNRGWVVHPKELGKDGVKHPIFTWGAGASTNASNYRDHLTHWASHGFVIEAHASTGDGSDHKKAIDYLIAQNDDAKSVFFGKLDTLKIASGGHSQGSVSTFAMADDPRLTTTIHVAGGSFDGNGPRKLKHPTAYILGEADTLATPNGERDYTNTEVPVFMTVIDGANHIYAAREGLPPITAWLRWQLAGESERKAQFIGASCEFCVGKYASMSKGF